MRSVVLAVVVAGGCIDTPPLAEPVIEATHVEIRESPEGRPPPLDVLIVLDDGAAMAPYQDRVAQLPAVLAKTLQSFGGGWIDVRVGVTTNDGRLRRLPGTVEPYLARSLGFDFTEHRNFTGTFQDALSELLAVGSSGAGPHQPLEAMRRALESSSQFLREPAPLSLLVIGASDDASPLPVADYVQWTQRLTRGTWWRPLLAIGVYPEPAERLDDYFAPFRAFTTPLGGDDDLRAFGAIEQNVWGDLVGPPCFEEALADREPATPGLQPDCTMSITIDGQEHLLPKCGVAAPPVDRSDGGDASPPRTACWKIQPDLQSCFYGGDHLALRFEGYTDVIHPAYRLECRVK